MIKIIHNNLLQTFFVLLMATLIIITIFAPQIAPYDPTAIDMTATLQDSSNAHIFGTDKLGRDIFSRVIWGGRSSIVLAIIATMISMLIGMALGIIGGIGGGRLDLFITGVANIFQGLPGVTFMIAIAALMGSGVNSLIIALVINSWAGVSRIIRSKVLVLKKETFIESAQSLGAGQIRMIVRYFLPGLMADTIVLFAGRISTAVLSLASLSYLGLGIQPPTPDWGVMISEARSFFRTVPFAIIGPGVCLVILSFGTNSLGDLLRQYLESKQ